MDSSRHQHTPPLFPQDAAGAQRRLPDSPSSYIRPSAQFVATPLNPLQILAILRQTAGIFHPLAIAAASFGRPILTNSLP